MRLVLSAALLVGSALLIAPSPSQAQNGYTETDLVSDLEGRAQIRDPNLVNPWGLVPGPTGVFWVSDNVPGLSTLYQPDGTIVPLVVTIPGGEPTGVVLTNAADSLFLFASGDSMARAVFVFVTQHGTVDAWHPAESATAIEVATTPDAIYTGAAIANSGSSPRLYAANFSAGRIDVFNVSFVNITASLPGSFTDPNLPTGYAPFNIAEIGGQLFVAYAISEGGDEQPGPGQGIVDVFDTEGTFVRRFATGAPLNAPWAIVRAPGTFGDFAGDVLVGNFGDGWINAFDYDSGNFVGTLETASHDAVVIPGLWGMSFGRGANANRLYFAAGIEGETHGLFGYLAPVPPVVVACQNDSRGVGFWRHSCGGPNGGGDGEGDGDGHGKGKDKDKDKNKDKDGDKDHGGGKGKGHGHGHLDGNDDEDHDGGAISADSLETLFGCVREASDAFGSSGCFTASCDLLRDHGHMSARDRAGQQFLTLLLNRCAGLVCDDATINCGSGNPSTVGEAIAQIDEHLCSATSDAEFKHLGSLAACALGEDEDEDGDHGGDDARVSVGSHEQLQVTPLGGNPVQLSRGSMARFQVSTLSPASVRFRIVDAAGRLIAEPMRQQSVTGSFELRWDGRDVRGALVPPGNYFYTASSGSSAVSGRIVIVR